MSKYYYAEFHYDNPMFDFIADYALKKEIEGEYNRLRSIACDELNPNYEKWNKEFGPVKPSEDDDLAWAGGTEYCDFIRSKQDPILRKINEREATFVKLRSTKECDIGGVVMHKGKELTNFYMTLKPFD